MFKWTDFVILYNVHIADKIERLHLGIFANDETFGKEAWKNEEKGRERNTKCFFFFFF